MSERIENIRKAVERAAECPAVHLDSVMVTEGFQKQIVWEGIVEVFALLGHAKAKRAYAWNIGEGSGCSLYRCCVGDSARDLG